METRPCTIDHAPFFKDHRKVVPPARRLSIASKGAATIAVEPCNTIIIIAIVAAAAAAIIIAAIDVVVLFFEYGRDFGQFFFDALRLIDSGIRRPGKPERELVQDRFLFRQGAPERHALLLLLHFQAPVLFFLVSLFLDPHDELLDVVLHDPVDRSLQLRVFLLEKADFARRFCCFARR